MESTSLPLSGKTALITGSSMGIGLATATLLAEQGARVMLNGRGDTALSAARASIGDRASMIAGDIGDAAFASGLVANTIAHFGQLDILVNAAGLCQPRALSDLSAEEFALHMTVNVTGSFVTARAAGLHMQARGSGHIINVASEQSFMGMAYYVAYSTSKHAVLGLTRALAAELAPHVKVNAIAPGPVDTPMLEAEIQWFGDTPEMRQSAWERVPLKRLATPAEIAKAILFLATNAPFATGSCLSIDGGTTMI